MDVNKIAEDDFNDIVDSVLEDFKCFCEEVLYEQDRFVYKKLSKMLADADSNLSVELENINDLESLKQMFFENDIDFNDDSFFDDYYKAVIYWIKEDEKKALYAVYQSLDFEKSTINEILDI